MSSRTFHKRQFSKGKFMVVVSLFIVFLFLIQTYTGSSVYYDSIAVSSSNLSTSNPLTASNPAASSTSTSVASSPISPGKIYYDNTWNNTAALACKLPQIESAPLVSAPSSSWNASIMFPTQMFMNTPTGQYITQHYSLYSNGTFTVSDNSGNHLSMQIQGTQAPVGTIHSSFVSNSSEAVLNYVVNSGSQTVSNVTVKFAVVDQFCKPAELEITVSGSESLGTPGTGTISFQFANRPSMISNDTAWFNDNTNSSAVPRSANSTSSTSIPTSSISLGFDWNNSQSLNPVYNNSTNTLSYSVGSSFAIDPTVVGTSSYPYATSNDYASHVCQTNGHYWFFYVNATNTPVYQSSVNGSVWSSATQFASSSISGNFEGSLSLYCSGSTVYYEGSSDSGSVFNFLWGVGTMQSSGTVSWTYQNTATTGGSGVQDGSIAVDSNGNVWVAVFETIPGNQIEVFKATNLATNSWTNMLTVTGLATGGNWAAQLVPLTSGKIALVYGGANFQTAIYVKEYSGTSWSASAATGRSTLYMGRSMAVAIGDTLELAAVGSTDIYYYPVPYGSSSLTSSQKIVASKPTNPYASISTDGVSELVISFLLNSTDLQYVTSTNSGNSWSLPVTVSTSESSYEYLSASTTIQSNDFLIGWTGGSSSPYNVKFMSEPAVVPSAASNPQPWSQPGLSPYESYFSQFDESVSPGNGLLGVSQTMFTLPGRHGLNLGITFVYSTPYAFIDTANTTFNYDSYPLANVGLGWSLNFPWLGANYLHLNNGEVFPYNWTGNVFVNHKGVNFILYANSNGTYTLYDASGAVYEFNTQKQLTQITDATGNNSITFSYSSNGISSITDTAGRIVSFAYNSKGEVANISQGGRTWSFTYSSSDKMNNVTDPVGRITQYHYVPGNPWLIQKIVYPTGGKTYYLYGSAAAGIDVVTYYVTQQNAYTTDFGPTLTNSTSFSYHIVDGVVEWANTTTATGSGAEQNNLNFSYTGSTKQVQTVKNATSQTILNYESDYDNYGRINASKTLSPSDTVLASTTIKYDNWGNVIYTESPSGLQTYYSYSNTNTSNSFPGSSGFTNSFYSNSIPSYIHSLILGTAQYQNGAGSAKQEEYFQYNSAGEQTQQKQLHNVGGTNTWLYTSYTYDKYGNKLTMADPLNRVTYNQYSSTYQSAYLTQSSILVNNQNVSTDYSYNFTLGLLSSETDPNGQTTYYSYDNIGRTTAITYPMVNGIASSTIYSYNDVGNYYTVTSPNGNSTRYYFDGLERPTQIAYYNLSSIYTTVNYTYSWLSKPDSATTASGTNNQYYDSLARTYKTTNPDGTSILTSYDNVDNIQNVTDENGHLTQYGYDWTGQLIWVRQYYSSTAYYQTSYTYDQAGNLLSVKDAKNQTTTYQYDDLNRLIVTIYPDGTNQTNTYDSVGNLISVKSPNGTAITYAYDALNRLDNTTYSGGSTVVYGYDKDGNRISMTYGGTKILDSYDARDRLSNETYVINGVSYSVLYSYDKASNIVSMTYPDNTQVSFSYDFNNRLTRVGSLANLTNTATGQINSITYLNGITTSFSYNSRNMLTRILSMQGSTKLLDLNYTYDAVGNIKEVDTESYTYDWLNRVSSSSGQWGTTNYTYDGAGNMLTLKQGSTLTNYTYASYNRLNQAGGASFTYDPNGNTIKLVNGSNTWKYTYDYENRLTGVTLNSNSVQNNTYSGDGKRVTQTTSGGTMVYIYDGLNIIYEKNLTSGSVTDLYYGDGALLAKTVNSANYYFLKDLLGSTRIEVNSQGNTVFSSNYKPFGLSYDQSGLESMMYTGKVFDSSTGLYYYNARFYNPSIQRFITEDNILSSPSDAQDSNRYMYARDNPLGFADPSGHWSTIAIRYYSWGTAYLGFTDTVFYGEIGFFNLGALTALVTGALILLASAVIVASALTLGAIDFLIAAVGTIYLAFLNTHTTSYNDVIPYAEIGYSRSFWWDPWNTGVYAEVGAYTNKYTNIQGATQFLSSSSYFFPFLTTTWAWWSYNRHSSIWPSFGPPW